MNISFNIGPSKSRGKILKDGKEALCGYGYQRYLKGKGRSFA
jgi:hypothetical protein